MGTVNAVLVREGETVRAGQPLIRIDARDLVAKAQQVEASIADAEATQREAATNAARFRALYADSAATRAQYDAALTALARADAGLRVAKAAAGELAAVNSYATVRAPFDGVVTARLADPGTFASPGAPLLTVQDVSTLRISASVGADAVRQVKRGQVLSATIDGVPVTARIEGIVPSMGANQFTVNATVDNRRATYRSGSSATLFIPTGTQHALLVPRAAIVRDGDLTGVIVRGAQRDERRWVRLGATTSTHVDVTSGLTAGEEIVIPAAPTTPKDGA
ncbi:MAG: efflux RND transporter periplasmic adaptor subunit, partial [Gemmatimonas sp.]